jgi:hypothetical protein
MIRKFVLPHFCDVITVNEMVYDRLVHRLTNMISESSLRGKILDC